jgi:uncharacterized membrane protein YgdD (TMEM256/DUF423 family)
MNQIAQTNLTTTRRWIAMGAVLAAAAVVMGAFGAHAMEDYLAPFENGDRRMDVWKTAAHYHIVHAIGLMLVGLTPSARPKLINCAGGLLIIGILVFSGLLYLYSYSDFRILGAFVPIGGAAMIAGWITFAVAAYPNRIVGNDQTP